MRLKVQRVRSRSSSDSAGVATTGGNKRELEDVSRECGGTKVTLLDIQSSPRGESSDSIALTTIQRFRKAGRIVLGTPMWNFGLPKCPGRVLDQSGS